MKQMKQIQMRHARAVVLLTKQIKGLKKSKNYTKEDRKAIFEKNGNNYHPLVAALAVRNLTVSQQARIYREILRTERPSVYGEKYRSFPLWGNNFSIKKILCESTLGPLKA